MTAHGELIRFLAARSIVEDRPLFKEAANRIVQQARDIAALKDDIEAQIKIASEEATLADACLGLLREIAALKRYNANVGITRQPATRWTINVPVDLMERVDAALARYFEAVHQELAPLARDLEREITDLKHDIERHLAITSEQASRITELEETLVSSRAAAMEEAAKFVENEYGFHNIADAVRALGETP